MNSDLSPIRILMNLRHVSSQRNDAVEAASREHDDTHTDWAFASRIWSRQAEALLLAVIAEPPTSVDDALSVLMCLAELQDRHASADDPSASQIRDVSEVTYVAIQNCVHAIAQHMDAGDTRPASEQQSLAWSTSQVARWLPSTSTARA